jgi:uncharacterized protein YecT (DUF1311 family)
VTIVTKNVRNARAALALPNPARSPNNGVVNPFRKPSHHALMLAAVTLTGISLLAPRDVIAQSQHEMNQEASDGFETADAELNKVYKQLLDKLDEEGQAKLKAAQRAWVAFRDADSDFQADLDARDGSMWPMIKSGRMRVLTEARTKDLRDVIDNYPGL